MTQLIKYKTASGAEVVIEAADDTGPRLASKPPEQQAEKLEDAITGLRPAIDAVFDIVNNIPGPEQAVVEFAIGFKAQVGAFLASGEANASAKITLTWKPKGKP